MKKGLFDTLFLFNRDDSDCRGLRSLRTLLSLPSLPQPTILNPAYSDGYVAAEPVMYQFNVNTPNLTQLRVS